MRGADTNAIRRPQRRAVGQQTSDRMACPASRLSLAVSSRKPCARCRARAPSVPTATSASFACRKPTPGIFARTDREQQAPGDHGESEARGRDRDEDPDELLARDVGPPAEQAEVQRHDGAHQQGDAEDVGGVGRGVEPAGGPQGLGDGRALEPDEQRLQRGSVALRIEDELALAQEQPLRLEPLVGGVRGGLAERPDLDARGEVAILQAGPLIAPGVVDLDRPALALDSVRLVRVRR